MSPRALRSADICDDSRDRQIVTHLLNIQSDLVIFVDGMQQAIWHEAHLGTFRHIYAHLGLLHPLPDIDQSVEQNT